MLVKIPDTDGLHIYSSLVLQFKMGGVKGDNNTKDIKIFGPRSSNTILKMWKNVERHLTNICRGNVTWSRTLQGSIKIQVPVMTQTR